MKALIAWVALFLIPVTCWVALEILGAVFGNGPGTVLIAAFVGFTAPLAGAYWLSERIKSPRQS